MDEPMDDAVAAEATRWLIARQEQPADPQLRARFDSWLAADPRHQAAWQEAQHVYGLIGTTTPLHAARWHSAAVSSSRTSNPMTASPIRSTPGKPASRPGFRSVSRGRMISVLAVAAIAACLAVAFFPDLLLRLRADYVTTTAERRLLHLADGSTLQLAPQSAVDIAFSSGERRIRLLQGEAYFEVMPDPARPFRVDSGNVRTTVFGTGFDVQLQDDGAEVAVRHGLVRVDYLAAAQPVSVQLHAGDWVRFADRGKMTEDEMVAGNMTHGSLPPQQVAAWTGGDLIAQDRTVGEIVADLRRYYHGLIILADPSLADQRLTGVYNLADPVGAVEAAARAHGGIVRHISPWILLISQG